MRNIKVIAGIMQGEKTLGNKSRVYLTEFLLTDIKGILNKNTI